VLRALGTLDADTRENEAVARTLHGNVSEDQLAEFLCTVGLCPPGESPRELPQWPSWIRYRRSLRNSCAVLDHADDPGRLRTLRRPVLLAKGRGRRAICTVSSICWRLSSLTQVTEMPAGHAPHIVSRTRFLRELALFHGGDSSAA